MHKAPPQYRVERRPYRGVRDTVRHMVDFVQVGQTQREVRNAAIEAIKDVYPHDYASELAAIYYDACRRVRYVRDPANAEMLHEPAATLRTGAGDCDDMAVVLGGMLRAASSEQKRTAQLGAVAASAGSHVQVVTAGFDSKHGEHSHTFLRVWEPHAGAWVVLDPVAGPHVSEMISRARSYRAVDVPDKRRG